MATRSSDELDLGNFLTFSMDFVKSVLTFFFFFGFVVKRDLMSIKQKIGGPKTKTGCLSIIVQVHHHHHQIQRLPIHRLLLNHHPNHRPNHHPNHRPNHRPILQSLRKAMRQNQVLKSNHLCKLLLFCFFLSIVSVTEEKWRRRHC